MQRQEREGDDPDDRGQKQRVLEGAAAFQTPNASRCRHLAPRSLTA